MADGQIEHETSDGADVVAHDNGAGDFLKNGEISLEEFGSVHFASALPFLLRIGQTAVDRPGRVSSPSAKPPAGNKKN
jgi:hypothetical protein